MYRDSVQLAGMSSLVCMLQTNPWQLVSLMKTLQRHSCEHLLAPHHAACMQHISTCYFALITSITLSCTMAKIVVSSDWMLSASYFCEASL